MTEKFTVVSFCSSIKPAQTGNVKTVLFGRLVFNSRFLSGLDTTVLYANGILNSRRTWNASAKKQCCNRGYRAGPYNTALGPTRFRGDPTLSFCPPLSDIGHEFRNVGFIKTRRRLRPGWRQFVYLFGGTWAVAPAFRPFKTGSQLGSIEMRVFCGRSYCGVNTHLILDWKVISVDNRSHIIW